MKVATCQGDSGDSPGDRVVLTSDPDISKARCDDAGVKVNELHRDGEGEDEGCREGGEGSKAGDGGEHCDE